MYIELTEAKSFLNVYFSEKDAEITLMIEAAEAAAAQFLQRPLSELTTAGDSPPPDSPGAIELKPDVKVAVLQYVSDFWQNREVGITGTIYAKNPMAESLLYPYRTNLGV